MKCWMLRQPATRRCWWWATHTGTSRPCSLRARLHASSLRLVALPPLLHSATTHVDLALRARERGIEVKVIHNASIMNAMGASGLQLYNFGRTVTVPFFTDSWRPDSFYDKIAYNLKGGMHTLVLLGASVSHCATRELDTAT